MKKFKTTVVSVILSILLVFSLSFAKRDQTDKKLPLGAYMSQIKIDIISGKPEQQESAINYLNELFKWYGPHAEALYWRGQLEVDYLSATSDPKEKMKHLKLFVAYADSLRICCDKNNKNVKDKYKKKCDEYVEKTDSITVVYWREFYNNGINLMNENIMSLQEDISNETDSAVIIQFQENLQAFVDTAVANFEMCLTLDPSKIESYIGLGTLFDKMKDYDNAIKWLVLGLDKSDEKDKILQTIAYDYIKNGDYAGAIPYMRDYVDLVPDDLLTMENLAICYNSQKMFDSSFAVNQRILTVEPTNINALSSVGHYFRQQSQDAYDSLNIYKEAKNEASIKEWDLRKDQAIDSFLVYYKRVLTEDPKNEQIQFLYATYNYFRSNWDLAIASFIAAAEINPTEKDYWRSLGDCYVQTKEYAKSAEAYEKVVALDPADQPIWEQLVSLYTELKQPKAKARAQKQLDALK